MGGHPPVLATLAAAGLAFLVVASGLDRIAAGQSGPTLPGFRGFSSDEVAVARLGREDLPGALAAAKTYLIANPVDARASSVLGTVLLSQGLAQEADRAFSVAGALGWRNRATQLYLMSTALNGGQFTIAAQRFDALMRTGSSDPAYLRTLTALEEIEEGRAALAEQLRLGPAWKDNQLLAVDQLELNAVERRIDTIARAEQVGMPTDCEARAVAVNRLFRAGSVGVAAALWAGRCGGERVGLAVADGGFERSDFFRARNPFQWTVLARGGTEVRIDSPPAPLAGQALYINSDASGRETAAQQAMTADPGRYVLRWDAVDSSGNPSDAIAPQIVCSGVRQPITPPAPRVGSVRRSLSFTIPTEGCVVQLVQIVVNASHVRGSQEGWIDNVAITPAMESGR